MGCHYVLIEFAAKLVEKRTWILRTVIQGADNLCSPPLSPVQWELVYDLVKLNKNRVFSFSFLHLMESGVFQRWMTWDARGDESISFPLFTVYLNCALAASAMRKGACLCLLASSWHAASRERREESSWDSSCSVWARNAQASKETRVYIFHLPSCFVCVCPYFNILGSWWQSLYVS